MLLGIRALTFKIAGCGMFAVFIAGNSIARSDLDRLERNALGMPGVVQLAPQHQAISFQQTVFIFRAGRSMHTDWGHVQADVRKLNAILGEEGGYLNVFIESRTSRAAWVIENLRIPPDPDCNCRQESDEKRRGHDKANPTRNIPMTAHFDLRPGEVGAGRVDRVFATVLASRSPLPAVARVARLAETAATQPYVVQQGLVDAEGDLAERAATPRPGTGVLLLGPPPQAIDPVPELPNDIAFPIEVIQDDQPNIQTASNQCVPMANANALGYLSNRYNELPLGWPLPHASTQGIGLHTSTGDVVFWQPVPATSRVAQVDARFRRIGVQGFESGEGADRCQQIRGVFSYVASNGGVANAVFRHQGGSAFYGAGDNNCDNDITLSLGGITSQRQGVNPTWQWMFDQLQVGRAVIFSFGRYDINGNRTGGHAVRVWEARRFNGRDYLYTLDDADQGLNSNGLRTEQWEVADKNQPGFAGQPNGRLELGGTNWEIEFAMSIEAKPNLLIP